MLDNDTLQQYIQALNASHDTAKQRAIILALKSHKEEEWANAPQKAVHSLITSLQQHVTTGSTQIFTRQDVLAVLGNMGPRSEPAIPFLMELLTDANHDGIREAATVALGKNGKRARVAVDALIGLLGDRRATLVVKAAGALADIGCADQRVCTALTNLWLSTDQSRNSQAQVAIALCKLKIHAPGLLGFLTNALGANQDSAIRRWAAEGLAWCNKDDVDVVPALLAAALSDKDEQVRQVAEAALAQLRVSHEKAIGLCAQQLKNSSYAEAALRHSGPPAVSALVEALESKEPQGQEKAARTLGCLGETAAAAIPALTKALHDKNMNVRLAVAKGLWQISKSAALVVPAMIEMLEENGAGAVEAGEPRRRFQQTIIEALGRIGPPAQAAVSVLTKKASDQNRLIRESAINALRVIAPNVAKKAAMAKMGK